MAGLTLTHVYKVYPNGTKAVNDFSLDIEDKEFIVFVGPSGCGKSTTLRMIAGLEDITAGEIAIDGMVVNDVEPKDRDIAMVFQNYALYPHMTVYENMAFGLKLRKLPNEEIHRRVIEAAQILGITEYLDRKPRAMSGGQRQRVALGRAIVREPKVFLLDEPLSNLDAKLRNQMRSEISKLHNRLNTTFIYVTHDQTEAMTMGTRIVVMKDGFVQQTDTPKNLYNYPDNKFVAGFIGTPQMNFFEAVLCRKGEVVEAAISGTKFVLRLPATDFLKVRPEYLTGQKPLWIGIRAEKISAKREIIDKAPGAVLSCTVSHVEELGDEALVFGDLADNADVVGEAATNIVFKVEDGSEITPGSRIEIAFDTRSMHFFDKETEQSVCPKVPSVNIFDATVEGGVLKMDGMSFRLPPAITAADGEVLAELPTDSILPDGTQAVQCVKTERFGDFTLAHLQSGDRRFFARLNRAIEPGDTLIRPDFKKITLLRDGKAICSPLPLVNKLYCKLIRVKESGDDGRAVIRFYLEITDGVRLAISDEMLKKLVTGGGKNVFKKRLRLEFSPYAVGFGDGLIPANASRTLDYGSEEFTETEAAGQRIYVLGKPEAVGECALTLDMEKITVIDDSIDIIIA